MKLSCPNCQAKNKSGQFPEPTILKSGSYYRISDRKRVQRYQCRKCKKHFSSSTLHSCYKQKKRQINGKVARQLVAGVSLRETARVLKINEKTVARKLKFMAALAREKNLKLNEKRAKSFKIQFDDLETFEHTKCKPISIPLVVEESSRWILGFDLAEMPCRGRLAHKALRKYGVRTDGRTIARQRLFKMIQPYIEAKGTIRSDENPHYVNDVRTCFPDYVHHRVPGGRGAATGQGELKKQKFDPIFSFNHTAAMVRYRMSRMIRKTWSTTKKMDGLRDHLSLFVLHHNLSLLRLPAG